METLYSIAALVAFYVLLHSMSTIKGRLAQRQDLMENAHSENQNVS
jgi:hypothetical protein